ncbi:hypothetical protein HDU98_007774 [Podochytrium sp. JEL0797]|nr:hypothetical protein HDU98_007774 [Podochytrium sp. JEL0797]
MTTTTTTHGSCLCKAITFTVTTPEPITKGYHCHCSICRKSCGAPFLSWITVPKAGLVIQGVPVVYRSSKEAVRKFCGGCGSQMFFEADGKGNVDVAMGVLELEEGGKGVEIVNIFEGDKVGWAGCEGLKGFETYPDDD